ncbi:MAG: DUF1015 domain-containing protein [Chloroflexi bacterium]|nr:DUF1015 domain-containing protein [Chloroflexota bacterium]
MAEIRPFRAVRYVESIVGSLSRVVTAPYDIISPAAQADFYARSAHNAIRLEFGQEYPTDTPSNSRYTRAAQTFASWQAQGVLAADDTAGLYVYDETFTVGGTRRTRRGLFALVRVEDWENGIVLPHERTLPKPKADRLELLRATRANFSPILAMYDDPSGRIVTAIGDAIEGQPPVAEMSLLDGSVPAAATGQRLWRGDGPQVVEVIRRAFATKRIFIADGHHRYETALAYRNEQRAGGQPPGGPADYALMLLLEMGDPGLVILPIHRLIRGLTSLDSHRLRGQLAVLFAIDAVDATGLEAQPRALEGLLAAAATHADGGHAFAVAGLSPAQVHILRLRDRHAIWGHSVTHSDAWRSLDIAVLHEVILGPMLGLGGREVESEGYVEYTHGQDAASVLRAVRAGDAQLAFLVNPTRVTQIRDVALASDRMPQKSTYFVPKPVTGLVFYSHALPVEDSPKQSSAISYQSRQTAIG